MARRKERTYIMLDTNIVVRALTNPDVKSASVRVLQLWIQRRVQLVVSQPVIKEYEEILVRLGVDPQRIEHFVERLEKRETVTRINLGRRLRVSRDPDDDPILSTAAAGNAEYLVTLDKDLLELAWEERRRLKFEIVTPAEFIERIE